MTMIDPVVITGVGACCSLGASRTAILQAMLKGGVAIDHAPAIERPRGEEPLAAQADEGEPRFGATRFRGELLVERVMASAIAEAGPLPAEGIRSEAIFGTTLGGLRHLGHALRSDDIDGYRHTTTATFTRDVLGGTVFDQGGVTVTAACASGLSTLILGATALLQDEADLVLAVGYDPISEFAYAGFSSLRLVTEDVLRPFTETRDGMRVGEGAAAFILERRSSALARGAKPLATVLGWGAASDSHHLTQPDPSGAGAARAITAALECGAGRIPDVMYAHATSTPANDAAEYQALQAAVGDRLAELPVTALKSRIGHTLGAAGAVETAVAIAAMEAEVIPSTANAQPDAASFPDLDLVLEPRPGRCDRAGVVSLGFGGADASLLLEREGAEESWPAVGCSQEAQDLHVTGVGILVPEEIAPECNEWHLDDAQLAPLEDARAVRRLSRLARLVRAAGALACRMAELDAEDLSATSGFAASRYGAIEYTLDYYEELIREGLAAGNPLYFAESVPNITSAQLSLGLGLREMCLSIGGTRTCGIEALHLARRHLASGQGSRAVVVAAEETHPRLHSVMSRLGMLGADTPSTPIAEGAVALVVETAQEVQRRGARVLATVKGTDLQWPRGSRLVDGMRALKRCATWGASRSDRQLLVETGATIGRIEHRALGLAETTAGPGGVERHAVGPLLALARWAESSRRDGTQEILLAGDESGGAAAVHLS